MMDMEKKRPVSRRKPVFSRMTGNMMPRNQAMAIATAPTMIEMIIMPKKQMGSSENASLLPRSAMAHLLFHLFPLVDQGTTHPAA
jgi:hypothetical protein